jgi:FkbM family methyltransferase
MGSGWIEIETLDRWAEREQVDNVSFIKLDTEGSELDILRGAKKMLGTVQVLRVEVKFNPIYRG